MSDDPRIVPVKALISKQVELIKAGDVEGMRAMVTDRIKDRVLLTGLQSAIKNLGSMTIDDLVASVESVGEGIKIKMKNGRTLTTLVQVGQDWKADTLWFK